MSEQDRTDIHAGHETPETAIALASGPRDPQGALPLDPLPPLPPGRRRLKKLRLFGIVLAVLVLGLISFVFGIFMSVASDLPTLDAAYQLENASSSTLLDDLGQPIGTLSHQNQVLLTPGQIPTLVKDAVISIEDKRFRTNSGVDLRGIARAFMQDILHKGAVQGASTIEQQFVKNELNAQGHRTILEKLREAALAYQLAHKWSKERIITEYLNTIYFGEGAYGIESAARTYFGEDVNHIGCGTPGHELCVQELEPWEAALLAGIIQSPTGYDPVTHPELARARRNVVLKQMLEQGYIERPTYEESINEALPAPKDVAPPAQQYVEGVDVGYFTSWVGQQVIDRYGATRAYDGGLTIKTTLDLDLQRAAEGAVNSYLPGPQGPTAAMAVIENSTGEVRAMVGGRNYNESPFNLATEGERQPGSSFKAFVLAAALERGISPSSLWTSKEKVFTVRGPNGEEKFVVHNDEDAYTGQNTLTGATAYSDNSIFAEVGLKVGTQRIADLATRMGITTPISTNAAMTIGGLLVGVTPLDMAHAYETIARGGRRVSGTLGETGAPVAIQSVHVGTKPLFNGSREEVNKVETQPVLPASVASTETEMLETVLEYGTAKSAAIGQFAAGKTGTTSNYGDAWFVGWDSKYTVAVWVGYPTRLIPMTTDFNGTPVLGGTFPALIWHNFMLSAIQIEQERKEHSASVKHQAAGAGAQTAEQKSSTGATSTGRTGGGESTSAEGTARAQHSKEGASEAPAGTVGKSTTGAEETRRGAGENTQTTSKAPPATQTPAATSTEPATSAPPTSTTSEPTVSPTGGVGAG